MLLYGYMRILKLIVLVGVGCIALVAIAGFIKFNIIQDDVYIQQPDGSVVPAREVQ
jgi:hypothetical protein